MNIIKHEGASRIVIEPLKQCGYFDINLVIDLEPNKVATVEVIDAHNESLVATFKALEDAEEYVSKHTFVGVEN